MTLFTDGGAGVARNEMEEDVHDWNLEARVS